jgi:predicted RNA-binding Zn-ribbon protein involved in translation (DUF1610 family)
MIGIMIELKSKCPTCGGTIAVNALVPKAPCAQCGKIRELDHDWWKTILVYVIKEGSKLKPGESAKLGALSGSFDMKFGRFDPVFPGTKKDIDMEAAVAEAADGKFFDPETGKPLSVRPVPDAYLDLLPGVKCLVCEDLDLLPSADGSVQPLKLPRAAGPRPFTCPSCGATLGVDGKERTVRCTFCGADAFLPDDVWLNLHPAKEAGRWYLWHDERNAPYEWEDELWDAVAGGDGNLYLALAPRFGSGGEKVILACLDRTFRTKWVRDDIECKGETKLAIGPDGRILLWSDDRNALTIHSPEDGSQVDKLGGTDGRQPPGEKKFTMKDCRALAADIDGTLLAYRRLGAIDEHWGYYGPVRHDMNGADLPVWPEPKKAGFFKKMKGLFSNTGEIPYFSGIGNRFLRVREHDVTMSVGRDGSYFFLSHKTLARFDRDGGRIYAVELPCDYTYGRACADEEGRAFVIGYGPGSDVHAIHRISPDGKQIDVLVPSVLRGGAFCVETVLARSADGTLFAAGYCGRMRVFSPEGKLVHASARSLEKEKELLEKARKAQA